MFSGRLSVRPLMRISRDAITLYLVERFNETCHKYSLHEWKLLKRFSRSEVKGQGHIVYRCVNAITAEAYVSRMWRRGLLVIVRTANNSCSRYVVQSAQIAIFNNQFN